MSLLATSYRYERENGKAKALQRAIDRQNARVKEDEDNAERSKQERLDERISEMTRWSERLEETSEARKKKREAKAVKKELQLAGRALIKVRRAQLTSLLEEERMQNEKELALLGKAFYIERL